MPYVYDPNQNDDEQQSSGSQSNDQATAGNSVMLGGGSAAPVGGAGGGAPAAPGQPKATRSGSWSNLSQYVKANEGQSGKMAGTVVGNLDSKAKVADDTTGAWAAEGTKQATAAKNADADSVIQGVQKLSTGAGAQLAKADYDRVARGQTNVTDVGAEFVTNAQKAAGDIDSLGGMAASGQDADKKTLLSEVYGKEGKYQPGMKTLDSFLLGADTQASKSLQDAGEKYTKYGSDKVEDAQKAIDSSWNDTRSFNQQKKLELDDASEKARKALDTELAMAKVNAALQTMRSKVAAPGAAAKGLTHEANRLLQIVNQSPGQLVTQGVDYSAGDMLSDQQIGAFTQLGQLVGGPAVNLSKAGGSQSQVNQAKISALNEVAKVKNDADRQIGILSHSVAQRSGTAIHTGNNLQYRNIAGELGLDPTTADALFQRGVSLNEVLNTNPGAVMDPGAFQRLASAAGISVPSGVPGKIDRDKLAAALRKPATYKAPTIATSTGANTSSVLRLP